MQVCDKYNIDSKSRNFSAWESENWNLYEKNETTESKSQCELRILVKISGENDLRAIDIETFKNVMRAIAIQTPENKITKLKIL